MKARLKIFVGAILAAPLLLIGSAMAHGTENHVLAQQDRPSVEERVEKRKSELRTKLNAAELKRLEQRCKPSQSSLKKVGESVRANIPQRHVAFDHLNEHLTRFIEKLEAGGGDSTEIKAQQTALATMIAEYKADMADYQKALDTISSMDCVRDTVQFKASLEETRTLRADLNKSIGDIRTYVKETIKPTLVKIRQQLAANKSAEGEQ